MKNSLMLSVPQKMSVTGEDSPPKAAISLIFMERNQPYLQNIRFLSWG